MTKGLIFALFCVEFYPSQRIDHALAVLVHFGKIDKRLVLLRLICGTSSILEEVILNKFLR